VAEGGINWETAKYAKCARCKRVSLVLDIEQFVELVRESAGNFEVPLRCSYCNADPTAAVLLLQR
jgi:hypothetical protein